jgi:hypothetical protein
MTSCRPAPMAPGSAASTPPKPLWCGASSSCSPPASARARSQSSSTLKRATIRLWAHAQGTLTADLVHQLERQLGREPTYDECLAAANKQGLDLSTGLVDVRIHDLRHSFASGAVALGESMPMIGKLLGHTQVQTTARYAHLAADPVKAAVERVSGSIAAVINGQTGEVIQLLPRTGELRPARGALSCGSSEAVAAGS